MPQMKPQHYEEDTHNTNDIKNTKLEKTQNYITKNKDPHTHTPLEIQWTALEWTATKANGYLKMFYWPNLHPIFYFC